MVSCFSWTTRKKKYSIDSLLITCSRFCIEFFKQLFALTRVKKALEHISVLPNSRTDISAAIFIRATLDSAGQARHHRAEMWVSKHAGIRAPQHKNLSLIIRAFD